MQVPGPWSPMWGPDPSFLREGLYVPTVRAPTKPCLHPSGVSRGFSLPPWLGVICSAGFGSSPEVVVVCVCVCVVVEFGMSAGGGELRISLLCLGPEPDFCFS